MSRQKQSRSSPALVNFLPPLSKADTFDDSSSTTSSLSFAIFEDSTSSLEYSEDDLPREQFCRSLQQSDFDSFLSSSMSTNGAALDCIKELELRIKREVCKRVQYEKLCSHLKNTNESCREDVNKLREANEEIELKLTKTMEEMRMEIAERDEKIAKLEAKVKVLRA